MDLEETARAQPATRASTCEWRQQDTPEGALVTKKLGTSTTHYTYDLFGALREVTLPDGTAIDYVIDGNHRRIGKKLNGTLTSGYLYKNDLNIVAELDGTGSLVSQFVYGAQPHVPDFMLRGGKTYRIVSDERGSVRLVVDISSGAIAQHMDYDAWGNVTNDTNPGFQPFGFGGGLYDGDTGFVRFGARDYDARTGRWTTKDPIGFEGGGANIYAYAEDDAINYVDSNGEFVALVAGGVVVAAGANAASQWATTGHVDWGTAAKAGVVGGIQAAIPVGTTAEAALVGAVAGGAQYWWTTPACEWSLGGAGVSAFWGAVGGAVGGPTARAPSGGEIPGWAVEKPSRVVRPRRPLLGIAGRNLLGGFLSQTPDPGPDGEF